MTSLHFWLTPSVPEPLTACRRPNQIEPVMELGPVWTKVMLASHPPSPSRAWQRGTQRMRSLIRRTSDVIYE